MKSHRGTGLLHAKWIFDSLGCIFILAMRDLLLPACTCRAMDTFGGNASDTVPYGEQAYDACQDRPTGALTAYLLHHARRIEGEYIVDFIGLA